MKDLQTEDPKEHIKNIKSALQEVADHIRKDINKIEEPRAKALFETSAEILDGLIKAYSRYEKRTEEVWKS